MKIRESVFGSKAERSLYKALSTRWCDRFSLFCSLLFTNIVDVEGAKLSDGQRRFLLSTSVDFTLCEKVTDRPLLSVEFDGLGHGFSCEGTYVEVVPNKDPYRKLKFDLKLRLCHELGYPCAVVSYPEAYPLDEASGLTILDGIIGSILSHRRFKELLLERKGEIEGPSADEDYSRMKELYEPFSGKDYSFDDYIQDWVVGLEVEAELESDPICKELAVLQGKLLAQHLLEGWQEVGLEDPPAPNLDFRDTASFGRRIEALQSPLTRIGCEVTLKIKGLGDLKERVFLRNLGWGRSSAIAANIAKLLAVKRAIAHLSLR
jgi:hypothetical protein